MSRAGCELFPKSYYYVNPNAAGCGSQCLRPHAPADMIATCDHYIFTNARCRNTHPTTTSYGPAPLPLAAESIWPRHITQATRSSTSSGAPSNPHRQPAQQAPLSPSATRTARITHSASAAARTSPKLRPPAKCHERYSRNRRQSHPGKAQQRARDHHLGSHTGSSAYHCTPSSMGLDRWRPSRVL